MAKFKPFVAVGQLGVSTCINPALQDGSVGPDAVGGVNPTEICYIWGNLVGVSACINLALQEGGGKPQRSARGSLKLTAQELCGC